MGWLIAKIKQFAETPAGTVVAVLVYAAMIALVLAFFEGHGAFIYEGF